jgi:hypothetical protein
MKRTIPMEVRKERRKKNQNFSLQCMRIGIDFLIRNNQMENIINWKGYKYERGTFTCAVVLEKQLSGEWITTIKSVDKNIHQMD